MNPFFSCVKKFLCLFSLFAFFTNAWSDSVLLQQQSDKTIEKLYHTLKHNSKSDMALRLDIISAMFLGKAYLLGALGEGANARFDQSPLYRTDSFDCETYVDTVVAIALADNLPVFKQCINKIRYLDGRVDFIYRNHFASLDWNGNNQKQGIFADVTESIKNEEGQSIAEMATAVIDKPSWYQHLNANRIKLFPANPEEEAKRLTELKELGQSLPVSTANIPYLPLTALFDEQGHPNQFLFNQIPNAAVVEIVRPNWDLTKEIGTHLNVSHLGLVFWKNNRLVFRQASSTQHQVIEISLIDYLKETRASPTIKGINVQIIAPQKTLAEGCLAKIKR